MHGELKAWNEFFKTNFHGQDVPYNMYCNAIAVSRIYFVDKQKKLPSPGVYTDAKNQQCSMLSDSDDDDDDDDDDHDRYFLA